MLEAAVAVGKEAPWSCNVLSDILFFEQLGNRIFGKLLFIDRAVLLEYLILVEVLRRE